MNMDFLAIIPAMIPNIAMPFKILTNFKTGIRMNEYATVGSLITIILNNEILRYNASITLFSLLLLKFIQYGLSNNKSDNATIHLREGKTPWLNMWADSCPDYRI